MPLSDANAPSSRGTSYTQDQCRTRFFAKQRPCWQCPDPTQTRPLREARPTPRTNQGVERGSLRSKGRVGSAPIRCKRALFERHVLHPDQSRCRTRFFAKLLCSKSVIMLEECKGRVGSAPIRCKRALFERHVLHPDQSRCRTRFFAKQRPCWQCRNPTQTRPLREARPTRRINQGVERDSLRSYYARRVLLCSKSAKAVVPVPPEIQLTVACFNCPAAHSISISKPPRTRRPVTEPVGQPSGYVIGSYPSSCDSDGLILV